MPTLNEYFRTEAQDFLTALERSLQRTPVPDTIELHRSVRGLRGTAQMAREQRVYDVVAAFEAVTRSLAGGALVWSDQFASRARDTIADLRVLLDRTEEDEQLDARVTDAAARWTLDDSSAAPERATASFDVGTRELREFVAREAAAIADTLDNGIRDLQADPMDREPLRTILRRQRALLGSARLEEIPVVADILRSIEELTRVIAKLDVGVKQEWLDIYRVARDALQSTIAPLLRDEVPEPSKAVSRLRHMREELLERYGSAEDDDGVADSAFVEPIAHSAAPYAPAFTHGSGAAGQSWAEDADDDPALDLPAADEVDADDAMLDLSAADEVGADGAMLDLSADDEVEADGVMLDLSSDDEVDVDAGVLELSIDDEFEPVDDSALDPSRDAVVEAPLQSADGPAVGVMEIAALSYTREDALARAMELRDLIMRAAAHDPQARDAVDELFDLIQIALE
jgi:chemotaxis protein histidine kinase CheA